MRFLVDECLPHRFTRFLAERGYPDAVHPIQVGRRTWRDDNVVAWALSEERIIITANAKDFRLLLARGLVHPGCIIIQPMGNDAVWRMISAALSFLELQLDPASYMINRVVEVSATDGIRPYVLPPGAGSA